uniref:Sugar phosphate transporter domain-containing protein n=1 Tax=Mucochytrium quahogii TaxID=96639 RepID=A0A7S2RAY4_9STRA|mmetsp:Transcript_12727/g.20575  ORF Transcript_12727/g.20575 Transcript_12727/m.20575 type:complete len:362 (-) Transcript_12727:491-1576(-)|eukprot:CAMPEP_0203760658 /NCGR_PEP_ID=MMETSP0098-20131031/13909_1 /ASSEMBLY_ACC=CAM_ASM_000208 /TAXON_ID=96639 /ORGANISM=" , Strain NY0313808BC1" /LENGTH=361 /DNA_ID=CAMNT_0050654329 /DNA_START=356 /DNA_END=1441 /DNA_ORIENTATION=+
MDLAFAVEIGPLIVLWYVSSAIANTTSRKLLTQTPLPVLLTLLQFVAATIVGFLILHVFKFRSYAPVPKAARKPMAKLIFVYSMGFLFVNAGYVLVNVSLAETLRATEPLITVILAVIFLKSEPVSRMEMLCMAPIVLGGALSSFGDSSFSALGFAFVCVSNLSFSLRSMYTKKLREVYTGDAFNVFFHVSLVGTIAFFALLLFVELVGMGLFKSGYPGYNPQYFMKDMYIFATNVNEMLLCAGINGLAYATYNQTSFYILSRVRMVSHGVANAFRRVVTILFSVWYFGNHINTINGFGIALAIIGVVLYAKAKDNKFTPPVEQADAYTELSEEKSSVHPNPMSKIESNIGYAKTLQQNIP